MSFVLPRMTLVLLLALAPACTDEAEPRPLDDFRIVEPDGFVELVPDETVDISFDVTWAPSYSLLLEVVADGGLATGIAVFQQLGPRTTTWGELDATGARLPAGNYQLRAYALGPVQNVVQMADGGADHLIVLQGVRFRNEALSFTGGQASRELVVTTVARSTMELTLVLDRDRTIAGDELPLLTASIPGELAPIARSYPFTGMDASGAAIPAGSYRLAAVIRARGGAVTYRLDGPTLTWAP